jgi:hypothetical protein
MCDQWVTGIDLELHLTDAAKRLQSLHPGHLTSCFLQLRFERCQQKHAQNTDEEPCPGVLFGTDIVKPVIGSIGR